MTDTTEAADFEARCRQAIAPIVRDFLTKESGERDDMALTNRILTALGEQDALTESAYEHRDNVRACIIISLGRGHREPPEVAIVDAMRAKGFVGFERPRRANETSSST
jgi:hypothetical protein